MRHPIMAALHSGSRQVRLVNAAWAGPGKATSSTVVRSRQRADNFRATRGRLRPRSPRQAALSSCVDCQARGWPDLGARPAFDEPRPKSSIASHLSFVPSAVARARLLTFQYYVAGLGRIHAHGTCVLRISMTDHQVSLVRRLVKRTANDLQYEARALWIVGR